MDIDDVFPSMNDYDTDINKHTTDKDEIHINMDIIDKQDNDINKETNGKEETANKDKTMEEVQTDIIEKLAPTVEGETECDDTNQDKHPLITKEGTK